MPVRRMQYFHVEENQACCIGGRGAHSVQCGCCQDVYIVLHTLRQL